MSLKIVNFIIYIIVLSTLSIYSAFAEQKTITFDDGSSYIGEVVGGNMEGKGLFKSSKNSSNKQII